MSDLIFDIKDCYTPTTTRLNIPEIEDCDIDFVPDIEIDTASRFFSLPPFIRPNISIRDLDLASLILPCCNCDDFDWEIEPIAAIFDTNENEWIVIDSVYPAMSFRVAAKYSLGAGVSLVDVPTWEVLNDEDLDNSDDITITSVDNSSPPITRADVTVASNFSNSSIRLKLTANIIKNDVTNTCTTFIQLNISNSIAARVVSPGEDLNTVAVQFLDQGGNPVGDTIQVAKPTELRGFQGSYGIGDEVVLTYSQFTYRGLGSSVSWVISDKSTGLHVSPEMLNKIINVSGSTAPDSNTWLRSNQKEANNNRGTDVTIVSRMDFPIDTGKIYIYQRTLQFDSLGHLLSVSAETPYELTLFDCDDITSNE